MSGRLLRLPCPLFSISCHAPQDKCRLWYYASRDLLKALSSPPVCLRTTAASDSDEFFSPRQAALVPGYHVFSGFSIQLIAPLNRLVDCLALHRRERAIVTHLINGASADKLPNVGPLLSTYHRQTDAPTSNSLTCETGTPGASMQSPVNHRWVPIAPGMIHLDLRVFQSKLLAGLLARMSASRGEAGEWERRR